MSTSQWSVTCVNDGFELTLRFESVNLNGDGAFDRQVMGMTQDPKTVYLPAATSKFVVELEKTLGHDYDTIWTGSVTDGGKLVVTGIHADPKVTWYTQATGQAAGSQ